MKNLIIFSIIISTIYLIIRIEKLYNKYQDLELQKLSMQKYELIYKMCGNRGGSINEMNIICN